MNADQCYWYERGLYASKSQAAEAQGYKEAYFALLESIAQIESVLRPAPTIVMQIPQRKPLTHEQKLMCWSRATCDADVEHKTEHQCLMDYGSEIEAAHGIKGDA